MDPAFAKNVALVSSLTSDLEPEMAERFTNERKIVEPRLWFVASQGVTFSFIAQSFAAQDLIGGMRRVQQFQLKLDLILVQIHNNCKSYQIIKNWDLSYSCCTTPDGANPYINFC